MEYYVSERVLNYFIETDGPDLWDYHTYEGKKKNKALQDYQPCHFHSLPEPPKRDSMPMPEGPLSAADAWKASAPVPEEP